MIRINWADPITKGLKSLIAWDGRDYVANKPAVWSGTATGTDAGPRGVGRQFAGSGDQSSVTTTGWATAGTMLVVLNKVGSTGTGYGVAGNRNGGLTGGGIMLAGLGTGQWGYIDGTTEKPSGQTLAASDSPVLAVSVVPSAVYMYYNGVEVYADTIANQANGVFCIGAVGVGYGGSGVSANVVYGAYWDRRLTVREQARIAKNTWCLFEPELVFLPASNYSASTSTTLTVTAGALTITGQSITFNRTLVATNGALTLAGQAITFNRTMPVTNGALTVAGQTITMPRTVVVGNGDVTLTGQSISLLQGTSLSVTAGALTITGQDITFAHTMPVTTGAVTITGQTITLTAGGSVSVALDAGALTITGQSIGMAISQTVTSGALALNGQSIVLSRTMPVTAGALTITGQSITLTVAGSVTLSVTAGALTITGQDITMTNSGGDVYFRRVPAAAATSFVEISQSTGNFTEIVPKPAGSVDP